MKNEIIHDFCESVNHINVSDIIVLKDGEVIARHHWDDDIRKNQFSVSKSFTSTAIGMAIGEGLLSLDDRLLDFFPEYAGKELAEGIEKVKLSHLLTMSLGHGESRLMAEQRFNMHEDDWLSYSLSIPLDHEAGSKFVYSNVDPYLGGMILKKLTGKTLLDYLMPRLFEPLGIWRPTWETDNKGDTFGSSGLMITTMELAKFGQLYLQRGLWEGRQLIPEFWIDEVSKAQIQTGEDLVYNKEYSYLFWLGPDGSYRADGKYGQYSIIFPDKNAVIALNAYNLGKENILDYLWEHVVPRI